MIVIHETTANTYPPGKEPWRDLPIADGELGKAIDMLAGTEQRLVRGLSEYGHPAECFKHIAALWTAYFKGNVIFSERDVAKMMILMKIARDGGSSKDDNMLDICGYASLGSMFE